MLMYSSGLQTKMQKKSLNNPHLHLIYNIGKLTGRAGLNVPGRSQKKEDPSQPSMVFTPPPPSVPPLSGDGNLRKEGARQGGARQGGARTPSEGEEKKNKVKTK